MYDRSGDGTGSSEVKIRTNTAKFTNMIIARFRESRYLCQDICRYMSSSATGYGSVHRSAFQQSLSTVGLLGVFQL